MERPHIYFAGRMGLDAKNVNTTCYRPFNHSVDTDNMGPNTIITPINFFGFPILYTGPYRTGFGSHSGVHGDSDDHVGVEYDVFKRSIDGINKCEIFFAFIDDLESFGTIAEIGYAHGIGKRIIMGFHSQLADYAKGWMDSYDNDFRTRVNPLWFCARMAHKVYVGTASEVLDKFHVYLKYDGKKPAYSRRVEMLRLEDQLL